ncbi:MAG: DUF3368 domain-containing protein [Gammaproteobacteria bacterium]
MEHGLLLAEFFALPFDIAVPDVLYAVELEPYFDHLAAQGLLVLGLRADTIRYVDGLSGRGERLPSINDRLALGLAHQEACMLLTGDQDLRRLAETDGIEVHGTIWVLERILDEGQVQIDDIEQCFDRMVAAGSRLPREKFKAMLARR